MYFDSTVNKINYEKLIIVSVALKSKIYMEFIDIYIMT